LIILKNNEELLNRRMADLNTKEVHLKQKEYIIEKLLKGNNSLYGNDLQNFFTSSANECIEINLN